MATSEAHAVPQDAEPPRTFWQNFTQQRLKAWQPVLAPKWIISIYIGCGTIFVALGIALLFVSGSVTEIVYDYTDVVPNRTTNTSSFELQVPRDMKPPIWIYYELEGFHQNHRRYVKSRDDEQLREGSRLKTDLSACEPWVETDGRPNYPCGLIAQSVFNDSYTLALKEATGPVVLSVDSKAETIAWGSDTRGRFSNADPEATTGSVQNQVLMNMWLLNRFPPVECRQVNISDSQPYAPVRVATRQVPAADAAGAAGQTVTVADCRGYMSANPTCNFTRQGAPFNCSGDYQPVRRDWGLENGHFIVWMRVAGLPTFRKLWGKIDRELKASSKITVHYQDNFPVKAFHGRKSLVLSTSSILGGRNDFLGWGYVVVGACCLVFGLVFLLQSISRPRQLGDISLLAPQQ